MLISEEKLEHNNYYVIKVNYWEHAFPTTYP
jgi:hypothetical protein